MKVVKVTISQTIQVRQFEPLNVTMEFENDVEISQKQILNATRFVNNSVRAEYYRELLFDNGLSEADKAKYQKFIDKHINEDYFSDSSTKSKTKN